MNRVLIILLYIFLFTVNSYLFSQESDIYLLDKKLRTAPLSERPIILDKLAEIYMSISLERSIEYGEEALRIAKEVKITPDLEKQLNKRLGDAYYMMEKYELAIVRYSRELELLGKRRDEYVMRACFRLGTANKFSNKNRKAIEYFERSLEIAKEKDLNFFKLQNYIELYTLFHAIDRMDIAKEYYNLYLKLYSDLRFPTRDTIPVYDTIVTSQKIEELRSHYEKLQHQAEVEKNYLDSALNVSEEQKQLILQAAANKEFQILLLKYSQILDEREIELFDKQIQQQKTITFFFVFASIIILFFVISISRQYKLKKKANIKLTKSESELKELNATKVKFLSILAHDLKNPLSNLLVTTDVLTKHYNQYSKEKIKTYLVNMNKSSRQLYNLLENLLNWSRSQSGNIEFSPEVIELNYIVGDIVIHMSDMAYIKEIIIHNNISQGMWVCADVNMLEAIIRNLVSNAIKFTPKGGDITISAAEKTDFVEISVKDSGIGINPEYIEKLFKIDAHHSTLGTNNEKGSGLGLILCREFVEKHGGKIWVQSSTTEGSTFTFSLPLSSPVDKQELEKPVEAARTYY